MQDEAGCLDCMKRGVGWLKVLKGKVLRRLESKPQTLKGIVRVRVWSLKSFKASGSRRAASHNRCDQMRSQGQLFMPAFGTIPVADGPPHPSFSLSHPLPPE